MGSCISYPKGGADLRRFRTPPRHNDSTGSGPAAAKQPLWQDRQIRWDQPAACLALRPGEIITKEFQEVEDTKGQNSLGTLTTTNLRLIWKSATSTKLNITIGLNCIAYVHYNNVTSPAFGRVRAPQMMAQLGQTNFEFCFAVKPELSLTLFGHIDSILRRYRATKLFRDLALKDAKIFQANQSDQIYIMHGEEVSKEIAECDNVTSNEKFAGKMVITSSRVIWVSNRCKSVNVSVPYTQVRSLHARSSSFGMALVIETTPLSGGYVLGFNFASARELNENQALISENLRKARSEPFFGPLDGDVVYLDDRLTIVPSSEALFCPASPKSNSTNANDSGHSPISSTSPRALGRSPAGLSIFASTCGSETCGRTPDEDFLEMTPEPVAADHSEIPLGTTSATQVAIQPLNSVAGSSITTSSSLGHEAAKMALLSPNSRKYQAPKCVVCMATSVDSAFDPCGHLCCCARCALKVKSCPICRSSIGKTLKIYIPTI